MTGRCTAATECDVAVDAFLRAARAGNFQAMLQVLCGFVLCVARCAVLENGLGRVSARVSQIGRLGGLQYMTMRSLTLFTHVVGTLALFIALAIEWTAVELLRTEDQPRPSPLATSLLRRLPRFTAIAVALILASGINLAAQFGLLRSAWVGVSFVAMVLMGALGGAALRPLIRSLASIGDSVGVWRREVSKPFLYISLRARVAVALGIVYLMVAKPDLFVSTAIIAGALMAGAAAGVVTASTPAPNVSADQDGKPVARSLGASR